MLKKKLITIFAFILLFSSIITCTVFASSYKTTLMFKSEYKGKVRSFNGKNIQYSATTNASHNDKNHPNYTVTLYRSNLFIDDKIGGKKCKRDGYNVVKWSNVGKGKYYLVFSKTTDYIVITSNDVIIKNY